jgi:nucleotide sugar dehydrogenase
MKIGLIGNGFVGSAIYENLKDNYEFLVFDKDPSRANTKSVASVTEDAEVIFVALPTPMRTNGTCDLSIIFGAMKEVTENYNNNILVLKSTVPPGTCLKIKELHPELRIVFSPEFLTEANFVNDFKNCNRMIFGGDTEDTSECVKLLSNVFPNKSYFMTDWRTAETVKYFINTFLACKVSFANEMKLVCDKVGIDYDSVKELALQDKRIGDSHLAVPGPDGNPGFGGSCFPKDINAFISFAESAGCSVDVLKSAWNTNLKVRPAKDWEELKGRAIS